MSTAILSIINIITTAFMVWFTFKMISEAEAMEEIIAELEEENENLRKSFNAVGIPEPEEKNESLREMMHGKKEGGAA